MSTLAPDVLLEKQKTLKERLIKARAQVEILEYQASLGRSIDSHVFRRASADFNNQIPNGNELFGCSSSCSMFCKCSYHLFEPELAERHQLYMRYFAAKEAAEAHINEVEQTSFAIPGVKQRTEVVKKQKTNNHRLLTQEEEQLEIEL
ncbi:MAG TPA: hypothetical protein DCF43_06430 [Pseudomonas sp.]|nr:hypothetical protein [Pseudomonas sp.]